MGLTEGFADISIFQLVLVAAVALFASVVGGVTVSPGFQFLEFCVILVE